MPIIKIMHHKIVFTSDVHGNDVQYIKLRDYAIRIRADSVIIGGDIAPKYFSDEGFINGQRHFLGKRLPRLLQPIQEKLPKSRIFLMMGNDDCATNMDVLEKNEPDLFHIIHGKRIVLTEEYDIVGYSFVPITPFGIKDWEKYDLSEVPQDLLLRYEHRKTTNYNFSGYKTKRLRWEKFVFTSEMERTDSIQRDLSKNTALHACIGSYEGFQLGNGRLCGFDSKRNNSNTSETQKRFTKTIYNCESRKR